LFPRRATQQQDVCGEQSFSQVLEVISGVDFFATIDYPYTLFMGLASFFACCILFV
jgi:hypothetical protein